MGKGRFPDNWNHTTVTIDVAPRKVGTRICIIDSKYRFQPRITKTIPNIDGVSFLLLLL